MRSVLPVIFITSFASLSGCAKDYSLAPPADSEKVTVTVKVPKDLTARPMQVIYRSTICTFTDHTAMGKPYQRDDYQRTDIWPVRQGQSDLYRAELPMDGGGACQWRLSNVTFGVAYTDPTSFGETVSYGGGGGVVVIFDHNNSPRGGADFKVGGDLTIKQDYYPWISEAFLGGIGNISACSARDISILCIRRCRRGKCISSLSCTPTSSSTPKVSKNKKRATTLHSPSPMEVFGPMVAWTLSSRSSKPFA